MNDSLPKTIVTHNLSISQLAIGTAPIGGYGNEVEKDEAIATLRHAMNCGVTYFDSALFYGGGRALEMLGIALGESFSPEIVISFKVGRVLLDDPAKVSDLNSIHTIEGYVGAEHIQYRYDYSKQGTLDAFEQSLSYLNKGRRKCGYQALRPEDLNLIVFVHDPDVRVHGAHQQEIMGQVLCETFPQLKHMQDQGLLKAYGVGTNEIGVCLESLKDPHIKLSLLAGRGTLLCNGAAESPPIIERDGQDFPRLLVALAQHMNKPKILVAAIGNSGLGYGRLFYNYVPAASDCVVFREQICSILSQYNNQRGTNYEICDLLVRYPLDSLGTEVAAVMSGPRSVKEVDDVIHSYQRQIPLDLYNMLTERGLISESQMRR